MRYALAIVLLCIMAGCTWPKKLSSDIDLEHTQPKDGILLPVGIEVDSRMRHQYADADGLFVSTMNDRLCCWLAPNAIVTSVKPAAARHIVVTVLVPELPFFLARGQSVSVSIAGRETTFANLPPGVHLLPLDLSSANASRSERIRIAIRSSRTLVPVHEGLNTDTRALGVILRGVSFS